MPAARPTAPGTGSGGLESGDRTAFLGHLRDRLTHEVPPNLAHPLPPPNESIPLVHSHLLDPDDLLGSFVANATAVNASVHVVDGDTVPSDVLAAVVDRHDVHRIVVSDEPVAQQLAEPLRALGPDVRDHSTEVAAEADLGVTGCIAAIATTGTVVLSSTAAGGRGASLLPRVHLCVVAASAIVASSAEVLRHFPGLDPRPANLVLVTGPSKSGDIEQIIVTGVHGPVALELVVLARA